MTGRDVWSAIENLVLVFVFAVVQFLLICFLLFVGMAQGFRVSHVDPILNCLMYILSFPLLLFIELFPSGVVAGYGGPNALLNFQVANSLLWGVGLTSLFRFFQRRNKKSNLL